jgi:hypothetical protein
MRDPDRLAPQVRQQWQPFQDELFASAYVLAQQGSQWDSEGQYQEITRRLTRYMADNAMRMLAMVKEMVEELEGEKAPV